jgi:hypothetical protein
VRSSTAKFACADFTGGTSGSPWITRFDAGTRTGTIVGVIGGYQEGGDTPAVSYSAYLSDDIRSLYQQATQGLRLPAQPSSLPTQSRR